MRIIDKTAAQVRSLTPAEEELLVGFATGALAGPRLLQANQWLMSAQRQPVVGLRLPARCPAGAQHHPQRQYRHLVPAQQP